MPKNEFTNKQTKQKQQTDNATLSDEQHFKKKSSHIIQLMVNVLCFLNTLYVNIATCDAMEENQSEVEYVAFLVFYLIEVPI